MPSLDSVANDAHHVTNILRRVYPPPRLLVLINDNDGDPFILQARLPLPPTFSSNGFVIQGYSQAQALNQTRTLLNIQLAT